MARRKERLPSGLSRSLQRALVGTRIGTRFVRGRVADAFRGQESREQHGEQRKLAAAQEFSQMAMRLRGPFLKIGQVLSSHGELLSEQVIDSLKPLRDSVPPMGFDTVQVVVEEELGTPLLHSFADFGKQAAAAASLGQVHQATLPDGSKVAVKIQYPGAARSVRDDLWTVDKAARVTKTLLSDLGKRRDLNVTPMIDELLLHLRQETDYCREAYNAKLLQDLFAGDETIVIPRVHDTHSTLHLITYDWIDGVPLLQALRGPGGPRVGENLVRAFWSQLLEGGVLHADPHPGNFLVLPDGTIAMLDFGCVKVFEDRFLAGFRQMVRARLEDDETSLWGALRDLRLIDDESDAADVEGITHIMDFCSAGLREPGPFDFSDFDYGREFRKLVQFFGSRRRLPPSQRDFLFLSRVVLAYYDYLSGAGIAVNINQIVKDKLHELEPRRSIRVPPYDDEE